MDTKTLIAEARARFNHNSAKAQLKDKYDSKLVIAEQGGLWKATPELIGFLASSIGKTIILIDTFETPVMVDREALHDTLKNAYDTAMRQWYNEWKELEGKR